MHVQLISTNPFKINCYTFSHWGQVSKLKAFKIKIFCPPQKIMVRWTIRLTFANKGTVVLESVLATPKQVLIFPASNIHAISGKFQMPSMLLCG